MTPIELHEKAMHHSFLAKQAREEGNEQDAINNYEFAAEYESQAAEYYFEKKHLEPTRSILIRSAAFLNLKAGFVEQAEKFIFFGIVNIPDKRIIDQLYEVLELCIAYKGLGREQVSGNVDYIYQLRRRSIVYVLEPKAHTYGSAVSLDMITEFSDNYLNSLNAYSKSEYIYQFANNYSDTNKQNQAAENLKISPVLTNAGFGSFKFSLAVDFLPRVGESEDFVKFKSNVLVRYHNDVFINDFTDSNIDKYKGKYSSEEIDEIFRPLFNIRSSKSSYEIGYYDRESLSKRFISKAKIAQKKKLLPVRKISVDDIGYLESIISHTHETQSGSARKIIQRKQLNSYEFDQSTQIIEPKGFGSIILNHEIVINVKFNADTGFLFSFEELSLEEEAINFDEGLNKFYLAFLSLVRHLKLSEFDERSELESQQWLLIKKLINNPENME